MQKIDVTVAFVQNGTVNTDMRLLNPFALFAIHSS